MKDASHSSPRPLPRTIRGLRAFHVATHVVGSFLLPAAERPPSAESRDALSLWCQRLLSKFGVEVTVEGSLPGPGPFLIVSNHISWMDIPLIRHLFPAQFIAKEEISLWPVIGAGAKRAGTLFISREKLSSLHATLDQVCRSFGQGESVVLFPEGTTTTGEGLLPFRSGLFQSSLRTGIPILPLALRYTTLTGHSNSAVAYTGGESFGRSFWRTLGEPRIMARLSLCQPIFPGKKSRKELATEARQSILSALSERDSSDGRDPKLTLSHRSFPGSDLAPYPSPLSGGSPIAL